MPGTTDLLPYRVEWRANLVTGWVRVKDHATHEDALDEADESRRKWKGQTRVISQHVIAVAGLGA
jgi:hypothetical protein